MSRSPYHETRADRDWLRLLGRHGLHALPRITPHRLRFLATICAAADRGEKPSVRALCRLTGCRSSNAVMPALRALAAAGLVAWEPTLAGTLRPLVRIELWQ